MAYDLKLAERIRAALKGKKGVAEKEMFGGVAFLVNGKMFVGVVKNELMARVGKENHDAEVKRPGARIMDFTGRPMRGYLFVGAKGMKNTASLKRWVELCLAHAKTLKAR